MRIDLAPTLLPALQARAPAISAWKPGQVLTAEVIGKVAGNYTRLDIGGELVDARSRMPLQPGTALRVTVVATQPAVVLRAGPPTAPPLPGSVERALARHVPQQGTLSDALLALRTLSSRGGAPQPPGAPPAPLPRASALPGTPPAVADLTRAAPLRAALESAAQPVEAKIAAHLAAPQHQPLAPRLDGDVRTQLARVALALRAQADGQPPVRAAAADARPADTPSARPPGHQAPAAPAATAAGTPTTAAMPDPAPARGDLQRMPPAERAPSPAPAPAAAEPASTDSRALTDTRLRELVDGAIARIRTQQIASLQQPGPALAPLLVDLPVRDGDRVDLWHFDFERDGEAASEDGTAARAAVTLTLQLSDTHAVHARIAVRGDSVSVRIGADESALQTLMARHRDTLAHNLAQRGLEVAAVTVGDVATRHTVRDVAAGLVNEAV